MDPLDWSDDLLWSAASDDDGLWGATSDDEEVLAAALGLIETADPPVDVSSSSTDNGSTCGGSLEVRVKLTNRPLMEHANATPRRPKRGRPKTCVGKDAPPRRNMTKEAIEQLRPLVAKLEQQLAALQSHRADELQKNGDRKRARRDAWKSIAERQLVQRRRVESEKQTLVDLLADQTATLHKLQRLFTAHQNRLRSAMHQGILTPSHPLSSSIFTSGPASLETLHSLTLALGRMHIHTDAILADARFLSPETSCVEIKTEHAALDTRGLAVQLMDTRVVPFPMVRTADAVWLNLLNRANQKPAGPFVKDMIQSQFITHVPGFQGDVEAAMALQRVVEPDRVVMVRCSVFAYKNTEEDTDKAVVASGPPMTLHHFLWTAVSRVQDTKGGDDECQIQTCFISVPNLHGDNSNQTAAITKLCADVSRCFNADAHNEVDNFLLSGATGTGSL